MRASSALLRRSSAYYKPIAYGFVPQIMPTFAGISVYRWDINIRESTVLGLVGAGGIGQELKNAVDLLDFNRVIAILIIIVALTLTADRLSAALRRRLL